MWDFNFENLRNFHISLGLGLILAAFILYLTTFWIVFDKITNFDEIPNIDKNNKELAQAQSEFIELRSELILSHNKFVFGITSVTLVLGALFFLLGYIPWIKEEIEKTKRKTRKK